MTHTRTFGVHVPFNGGRPAPALDAVARIAGRYPDTLLTFVPFDGVSIPTFFGLDNTVKLGVRPFLTIEPHGLSLTDIAEGRYDSALFAWASALARFPNLVVRWCHEMNGDWYPSWGQQPDAYVAAWRHVRSIFRGFAPAAQFLWCPNRSWNAATQPHGYWPGAEWVDRVGLDAYNFGNPWRSPRDVLFPDLTVLRAIAPDKPLGLIETGCAAGPDRAAWFNQLGPVIDFSPLREVIVFYAAKQDRSWVFGHEPDTVREFQQVVRRWVES